MRYARDGRLFASCGRDGSVRLWDSVNMRAVRVIAAAHGGSEVGSVEFSADGASLLTAGRDSTARLWDVASGNIIPASIKEWFIVYSPNRLA